MEKMTVRDARRTWPGGDCAAEMAPANNLESVVREFFLSDDDMILVFNEDSAIDATFVALKRHPSRPGHGLNCPEGECYGIYKMDSTRWTNL